MIIHLEPTAPLPPNHIGTPHHHACSQVPSIKRLPVLERWEHQELLSPDNMTSTTPHTAVTSERSVDSVWNNVKFKSAVLTPMHQ